MKKHFFLLLVPLLLLIGGLTLYFGIRDFLIKRKSEIGCHCVNQKTATGNFEKEEKVAFFEGKKVDPLLAELPEPEMNVMGATSGEKWIEVDLTKQKLTAWEGDKVYFETLISSGKWYPTPTGDYNILSKFKYTKMSGGNPAINTYYYLPNVPYTMYFNNGFGLHGTYWHNNFGQPMSHGCVNLPTLVAEKLFYWTTPSLSSTSNSVMASKDDPGTRVVIHD